MGEDKIQAYAFFMLILQLSFVLIALSEVYPFTMEIAGMDIYGDITESIETVQNMYTDIASEGLIGSTVVAGMMLLMGLKITLEFLILVLIGAYPIMTAMGLPATFALPISLMISAICIYTLAVKFIGR